MRTSLFYHMTAQVLRVLPRKAIGQAIGRIAQWSWPKPLGNVVVRLYTRAFGVNLNESVKEHDFESFDDFFTRSLQDGARPLDPHEQVVVSPADGRIESIERIDQETTTFRVKGALYRVEDLLGEPEESRRYAGGTGCVIYLSPKDYHRVHSPVSGHLVRVHSMEGDYLPVNPIGAPFFKDLLVRNRRVALTIDTPSESRLGRVTVVMVAAMIVGRITVKGFEQRDVPFGLHHVSPPLPIQRGEELGIFHLGSTAVLLLEQSASTHWLCTEGSIRVGGAIAQGEEGAGKPSRIRSKTKGGTQRKNHGA